LTRDQLDYAAAIPRHKQALTLALQTSFADGVIVNMRRLGETLTARVCMTPCILN
jgi:hypothetical protein